VRISACMHAVLVWWDSGSVYCSERVSGRRALALLMFKEEAVLAYTA
jgi:hypothetical protein